MGRHLAVLALQGHVAGAHGDGVIPSRDAQGGRAATEFEVDPHRVAGLALADVHANAREMVQTSGMGRPDLLDARNGPLRLQVHCGSFTDA
jgi:hypothetical protein